MLKVSLAMNFSNHYTNSHFKEAKFQTNDKGLYNNDMQNITLGRKEAIWVAEPHLKRDKIE